MSKPRVVIIVDGGLVQDVYADSPVDIVVLDYDNLEYDPDSQPSEFEATVESSAILDSYIERYPEGADPEIG